MHDDVLLIRKTSSCVRPIVYQYIQLQFEYYFTCSSYKALLMVSDGDLVHYRIPGVLQRFAICYFVVAVMQLCMSPQYEEPQVSVFRRLCGKYFMYVMVSLLQSRNTHNNHPLT